MTRMKDIDLIHKVVEYLEKKANRYKTFPQPFTPTKIGNDIGAYIPRIGSVAEDVVKELLARGIKIEYQRNGNKRMFIIHGRKP